MAKPRARSGGTAPKRQVSLFDQNWDAKYRLLEAFKTEHGDCKVPRKHETLGSWVDKQRTVYKNDKLSDERVGKLNVLGFDWNPSGTKLTWEEAISSEDRLGPDHYTFGPLAVRPVSVPGS